MVGSKILELESHSTKKKRAKTKKPSGEFGRSADPPPPRTMVEPFRKTVAQSPPFVKSMPTKVTKTVRNIPVKETEREEPLMEGVENFYDEPVRYEAESPPSPPAAAFEQNYHDVAEPSGFEYNRTPSPVVEDVVKVFGVAEESGNLGQEQTQQQTEQTPDLSQSQESIPLILLDTAIEIGSKAWMRSKISLLGQGRAGKTAFSNALAGKKFTETPSTVGIEQLTCIVEHLQASDAMWSIGEKPKREHLAALANIAFAVSTSGGASPTKGTDIRDAIRHTKSSPTTVATSSSTDSGEVDDRDGFDGEEDGKNESDDQAVVEAAAAAGGVQQKSSSQLDAKDRVEATRIFGEIKGKSGLLISLFDFGGQAVFDVIHHLFLTRNGVYALVFNMEWLVNDGPDKVTALSFMRKWLSSIAAHTLQEGRTAPIVIVSTHLDKVSNPAAHERISTILYDELHDTVAWPSVLMNHTGKDSHGRAEQVFFPVDNTLDQEKDKTLGQEEKSIANLLSVVQSAMDKAEYTHKEVPLTWFKAMDELANNGEQPTNCLTLKEVEKRLAKCGVTGNEVGKFLTFLHEMGHLMWLNQPNLRDVVILDPVSYLVTPATIIICKLAPDSRDSIHHHMEVHTKCRVLHRAAFKQLVSRGLLDAEKLLPILWETYMSNKDMLLRLMVRYGLLIPLRDANMGAFDMPSQFLVPSLLPYDPNEGILTMEWTSSPSKTFYLVFTLEDHLESRAALDPEELAREGFLPGGMFGRLIGEALSWSRDTALETSAHLDDALLRKNWAILSFGRQRFRLVVCEDIHCVRVDVEGSNPAGIQRWLSAVVKRSAEDFMPALRCFAAVLWQPDTVATATTAAPTLQLQPGQVLIPLERLRKAVEQKTNLKQDGRTLLKLDGVRSCFGQWLQYQGLRERYDVFIGHGGTENDAAFARKLCDTFSHFGVGEVEFDRAVQIFCTTTIAHTTTLEAGTAARALARSTIALPVVSQALLLKLRQKPDDAAQTSMMDTMMAEWILMLECQRNNVVKRIFPVLVSSSRHNPPATSEKLVEELLQVDLPQAITTAALQSAVQHLLQSTQAGADRNSAPTEAAMTVAEGELRRRYPTVGAVVAAILTFATVLPADFSAEDSAVPKYPTTIADYARYVSTAAGILVKDTFVLVPAAKPLPSEVADQHRAEVTSLLREILCGMRAGQSDLAQVLANTTAANNMMHTMIAGTHDIPTSAAIFPEMRRGVYDAVNPMRLVRTQYRLFFICALSGKTVPCGPNGEGYLINLTREWVIKAKPVFQAGLIMLKVALLASGIPLPIPDLCNLLPTSKDQERYFGAVINLLNNPPDDKGLTDVALEGVFGNLQDVHIADVDPADQPAISAYCRIKSLLPTNESGFLLECGVRKVTNSKGITAWVKDDDITERDWKAKTDKAEPMPPVNQKAVSSTAVSQQAKGQLQSTGGANAVAAANSGGAVGQPAGTRSTATDNPAELQSSGITPPPVVAQDESICCAIM